MARLIILLSALVALAVCVSARPDKIVCYYESWAVYREGNGRFPVESIDPHKCTHAIYTFVGINGDGSIRINDQWNDIDLGAIRRFNELKLRNPKLKTLVAIGGWNEGSAVFSQVAANAGLRQTFAQNALRFIQTHGFDGFDLDWEYPAQRGGSPDDKQNVNLMLQALRQTFDSSGKHYLLTAAVAASATSADLSYDIPAFAAYLDFINIMAYDFHGAFDGLTGFNAPLYADDDMNVDAAVKHWIARGAPLNKIVLGMPVYGRSFSVHDPSNIGQNNGLNLPASAGTAGPWTKEAGYLAYHEICQMKAQGGWTEVWDERHQVPAMWKGNQWVGFDDVRSVTLKAEYAVQMNLGGAMVWALDIDDHLGTCGSQFPILSTVNQVIFGHSKAN